MADSNLTVFQRLTQMFGFPGKLRPEESPSFNFSKDEILKTNSREEYEKAALQAQQNQYIADKWTKLDQSLYNQSVYYEPNRLSAYYDYESMEFSIFGETKIATPDGFVTIKELADKGRDHEFITYAYDHNTKKVVPAIARNAHYTRDEMTYKIIFDDNSHIIATYGHRFLKRDGVFCEVENLKPGDSMMPFYRKSFYNNEKYNWIYTCNSKEGHHGWISEHNLISEWFYKTKINKDEEVHHIDFNGKNNLPNNLKIMKRSEHRAYHVRLNNEKLWANPDYRKKMSEVGKRKGKMKWEGKRKGKNNPAYIDLDFKKLVDAARLCRTQESTAKYLGFSVAKLQDELKLNGFKNWLFFLEVYGIKRFIPQSEDRDSMNFKVIPWDLIIESAKINKTLQSTSDYLGVKTTKLRSTLRSGGYKNWGTFMEAYGMKKSKAGRKKNSDEIIVNHKIVSIEPYGVVPVYDLTVPGYKNFATDTIFSHNTPEISASLDIYAEESTTLSEKGEILTIFSESTRVKKILEDLFINRLDLNTNLQMWVRGVCKYGDNFVYLKIDPEKGIIGCQQLPNIEIQRIEGRESKSPNQRSNKIPTRELRFQWTNKELEFQAWEIAHFRLLGDDRKLPYGTSMLDKIRRIWKQLLLAEDAMLIYRTCLVGDTRVRTIDGYKYIKDIQEGDTILTFDKSQNLIPNKVTYVKDNGIKKVLKLKSLHNEIICTETHPILVQDENVLKYVDAKDLMIKKHKLINTNVNKLPVIPKKINRNGEVLYSYLTKEGVDEFRSKEFNDSISEKMRKCGDIKRIRQFLYGGKGIKGLPHLTALMVCEEFNIQPTHLVTYTKGEIKPNTLNLPDYVDTDFAKLFGFMIGDGFISGDVVGFAEGSDDEVNEKYYQLFKKYESRISLNVSNNRKYTSYSVSSKRLKDILIDLGYIKGAHNKRIPKWVFQQEYDIKKSFMEGLMDADGCIRHTPKGTMFTTIALCNKKLIEDIKELWSGMGLNSGHIKTRFREGGHEIESGRRMKETYSYEVTISELITPLTENIINISEWGEEKVYDISVEHGEHNFIANNIPVHNTRAPERRVFKVFVGNMDDKDIEAYVQRVANKFKRDQIVDSRNGQVDMRYNQMAVDQDYFIPVRDPSQTNPIETLPGAQNLGEIADIEYIQKKMLAALRIPKAFLGFEEVVGDGKQLALMDIRFARTINRIQKSLVQELNKIALMHLYLLGMEDELDNFTLSLTNPSAQSDLLRIEQWKEKILLYKDATSDNSQLGILPVSHTWAKKNILGMSDNEVLLDLQQQRLERAMGIELQNTQNIIKRSGVFDDVDSKYGISKEERDKLEKSQSADANNEMGGADMGGSPSPPSTGASEPLAESTKKRNILNMLGDGDDLSELFDINKAQKNIYEIENKLKNILNEE